MCVGSYFEHAIEKVEDVRRPHANIEDKKEKRKRKELYLSVRANFLDGSREGSEKVKCYQLAPGGRERLYCFPLFAHDQLITTSVTSHSNGSKLRLAWLVKREEAIDVEQRKDKYWLLLTGYLVICSRFVRFVVYIVCL